MLVTPGTGRQRVKGLLPGLKLWRCFGLLLLAALPAFAAQQPGAAAARGCDRGSGNYRGSFRNNAYILTIGANPENEEQPCHAELRDSSGQLLFETSNSSVNVILTGEDVNGDGQPDVVLEGYSGGAHCCWQYSFVSVGSKAGLVGQIDATFGMALRRDDKLKRVVLVAGDGAFDYFDGLCHACSPSVLVYFVLNLNKFEIANRYFLPDYDKSIAEARAQLTPEKIAQFRHSDPAANANPGWALNDVKTMVLTVVLNYLYSGREEQAWKELETMWPQPDQARIKAAILSARANGILKQAAEWNGKH